jgi:hypothetical protein
MTPRRIAACLILFAACTTDVRAAQAFGGCPVFPADNYWNSRIDSATVHPSSAAWVNAIGAQTRLHADFSNDLADNFGFNPVAVNSAQPGVAIFYYPGADPAKSDPGPYPVPPSVIRVPADTGDREVAVVDATNCLLFEFYGAPQNGGASWITSASAKWDLRSNALRPDGWESGDHAGLPFLAGLMRWEEVVAGEIGHAVRITASNPRGDYLWPARHGTGTSTDPSLPPLGARFRLKASFDISGFDTRTQVVLRAFKRYGVVLASGGGNWYLQGVSDPGWPDVVIGELQSIAGESFEAIDTAPLMVNVNSGQAVQLTAPPPPPPPGGGTPLQPDDGFPPGGMPSGWIQPAGSTSAWVVANDAPYAGSLALKSGLIGAGQRSDVSVTRNFVAGNVSFARKVSSAATHSLQFLIDGVMQGTWSGEQDWSVVTFAIPPGAHTLLWRYSKDGSPASGSDAAWIDGVSIPGAVQCLGRRCAPR